MNRKTGIFINKKEVFPLMEIIGILIFQKTHNVYYCRLYCIYLSEF